MANTVLWVDAFGRGILPGLFQPSPWIGVIRPMGRSRDARERPCLRRSSQNARVDGGFDNRLTPHSMWRASFSSPTVPHHLAGRDRLHEHCSDRPSDEDLLALRSEHEGVELRYAWEPKCGMHTERALRNVLRIIRSHT